MEDDQPWARLKTKDLKEEKDDLREGELENQGSREQIEPYCGNQR
jgi:hypothetical protein